MKLKSLYALLLITLSGCSSIYHLKDSHVPEGYFETKVGQNIYDITFEAYRDEDWEVLEKYLFERAGEIGKENDFHFFSHSIIARKEKQESVIIPAVVVPEAMGNCGHQCTPSNSGMVIPEHQIEFNIRSVSSTFTYDSKVEGKDVLHIDGEP
ncbi:MAG: hypothetical protein ACJAZ6_001284 [Oleispira sp.]|jgi:uncharacterized protein YceK